MCLFAQANFQDYQNTQAEAQCFTAMWFSINVWPLWTHLFLGDRLLFLLEIPLQLFAEVCSALLLPMKLRASSAAMDSAATGAVMEALEESSFDSFEPLLYKVNVVNAIYLSFDSFEPLWYWVNVVNAINYWRKSFCLLAGQKSTNQEMIDINKYFLNHFPADADSKCRPRKGKASHICPLAWAVQSTQAGSSLYCLKVGAVTVLCQANQMLDLNWTLVVKKLLAVDLWEVVFHMSQGSDFNQLLPNFISCLLYRKIDQGF